MEQLLETAVALAEQGRTMLGGIPKPLELALFTREFGQEVQAAFPPFWLQRLVLAPLAWLAKLRGRDLDQDATGFVGYATGRSRRRREAMLRATSSEARPRSNPA